MKSVTPGPSKDIWLHLLKAGEWLGAKEIRESLPHLAFSNFNATLSDMAEAGTVAVRVVNQRKRLYAVTTGSRITRGLTVRELMAAMPDGQQ